MNPATPPPLQRAHASRPAISPTALSALVSPGVGQLMQRRWVVGVFFLTASTLAAGWLLTVVFGVVKTYYGLAFDPMNAPAEAPGLASLMIPFFIWLTIYAGSLIDTAIASCRQQVKREMSC